MVWVLVSTVIAKGNCSSLYWFHYFIKTQCMNNHTEYLGYGYNIGIIKINNSVKLTNISSNIYWLHYVFLTVDMPNKLFYYPAKTEDKMPCQFQENCLGLSKLTISSWKMYRCVTGQNTIGNISFLRITW